MKSGLPVRALIIAGSVLGIVVFIVIVLVSDEQFQQRVGLGVDDNLSLEDYRNLTQRHVEAYQQWALSENTRVFDWHLRSTKILFFVSILIAIAGLAFAGWQLVEASRTDERATQADELEVKTAMISVAFKSRSVAALVLFVSVAYFLLYVVFVYPIKVGPQPAPVAEEPVRENFVGSNSGNAAESTPEGDVVP